MRIEHAMNAPQLRELIAQGETAHVEFKSSFQKEVIETLTAFANTKGGAVLLGINDSRHIVGVTLQAETVQGWINQCKQATSPRIIPDIDLIPIDGKTVAVISLGEYPIKPVACKGRYYTRAANANHQMTATEISDAHIKLINSSWDYHPDPEHNLATISEAKVKAFADAININAPFDAVLEKFELVKSGRPTFACHLLFSKSDVFLSTIEAGRFASATIIKDSITSRDTLRDYRSANDSTIKVFDDHIEFFNPGVLLDDLTVEKIKTGQYKSHLRNKQVATIFRELELIEKYGSGVRRVIDTFVAYGLPEPEFEATQGGMAVTVFKNRAVNNTPPQPESQPESRPMVQRIIAILAEGAKAKQEISLKLGQQIVSGQLNKVIRDMLKDRLIEQTLPDKPQSRLQKYRPTQKGLAQVADKNQTTVPIPITSADSLSNR